MSAAKNPIDHIANVRDLLAIAYQIEVDAVDRYDLLADQMDVCNNNELAELFRKLSHIEGLHAKHILEQAGAEGLPDIDLISIEWEGGDSPEALDLSQVHYLMKPWHAVKLALAGEQRAQEFFEGLRDRVEGAELIALVEEFAEEEREHVEMMQAELAKYPEPKPGWDEDPDPANYQE